MSKVIFFSLFILATFVGPSILLAQNPCDQGYDCTAADRAFYDIPTNQPGSTANCGAQGCPQDFAGVPSSGTSAQCNQGFCPLEPIGSIPYASGNLGDVLNAIFRLGIGIAALLAVITITWGGFQYMTSDAIGDKSEGRSWITSAIYGLLIILFSWILLTTINPQITKGTLGSSSLLGPTSISPGVPTTQTNTGTGTGTSDETRILIDPPSNSYRCFFYNPNAPEGLVSFERFDSAESCQSACTADTVCGNEVDPAACKQKASSGYQSGCAKKFSDLYGGVGANTEGDAQTVALEHLFFGNTTGQYQCSLNTNDGITLYDLYPSYSSCSSSCSAISCLKAGGSDSACIGAGVCSPMAVTGGILLDNHAPDGSVIPIYQGSVSLSGSGTGSTPDPGRRACTLRIPSRMLDGAIQSNFDVVLSSYRTAQACESACRPSLCTSIANEKGIVTVSECNSGSLSCQIY